MNRRGFVGLIILLVVGVVVVGGILYYATHKTAIQNNQASQPTGTQATNSATTTQAQTSISSSTANWKTYTNDQYKYQIMYPSDWPAALSGNVLTIGNIGTAHSACYLTITFDTSSTPGAIIPAPHTYNYFAQTSDEQKCQTVLSAVVASGNFTSQSFRWPSTYQVDVKTIYVDKKTGKTTIDAWSRYSVDGLKVRIDDLQNTSSITIFRLDQRKVYNLEVVGQVYDVLPTPTSTTKATPPFDTTGFWQNQGSEVVSQQPTNKYAIFASPPAENGNPIIPVPFYVWLSAFTGAPVQAQFPSGVTMNFSNYSTAPIPASEFEIPSGYTNFNSIPKVP